MERSLGRRRWEADAIRYSFLVFVLAASVGLALTTMLGGERGTVPVWLAVFYGALLAGDCIGLALIDRRARRIRRR